MAKAEKAGKAEKLETAAPEPSYETTDGNEALRYIQAGGKVVSVTALHPSSDPHVPTFRPGKRYRFIEPKSALDQLLKQAEEG